MKRRLSPRFITLAVCVILIGAYLGYICFWIKPSYQGKSVAYWLDQLSISRAPSHANGLSAAHYFAHRAGSSVKD